MMIIPSPIGGTVIIPPSKSMAHRAIICASLALGKSRISNVDYSEDILATMEAMRSFGASILREGSTLEIEGAFPLGGTPIDCGESGSTLRFILPLGLLSPRPLRLVGRGKLGARPLEPYFDIFQKQGIIWEKKEGLLDLSVEGMLKAGEFRLRGDVSSQFVSGLCFALPLLEGDSRIVIEGNLESLAYIEMTLQMLERFGIELLHDNFREYRIRGGQKYRPQDYSVEADYSQSAFFFVMGALGKGLTLRGLNAESKQGDRAVIDIMRRMGADIQRQGGDYVVHPSPLKGTVIDAAHCPDIIPVLAAAASCAKGRTEIINAKRLRIKECDRLAAMTRELSALGAKVTELPEGMIVEGGSALRGSKVSAWGDHRIAMSLASLAQKCEGALELDNPSCVAKSFPNFWQVYQSIGGKIKE